MKQLGRKALRKQARQDKKQRKNEFFNHKKTKGDQNNNNNNSNNGDNQQKKPKAAKKNKSRNEDSDDRRKRRRDDSFSSNSSEDITSYEQLTAPRKKNKIDIEREKREIEKDELEIKHYEKLLKLKTYTKKNRLPTSFYMDGLGELIEVCDKKQYSNNVSYNELSADLQDDLEYLAEKRRKQLAKAAAEDKDAPIEQSGRFPVASKKNFIHQVEDDDKDEDAEDDDESDLDAVDPEFQDNLSELEDEPLDDEEDDDEEEDDGGDLDDGPQSSEEDGEVENEEFGDEGELDDEELGDEEGDFEDEEDENEDEKVEEFHEDIYGFLRDAQGNIVKNDTTKRDELLNSEIKVDEVLQRKIRGLLNRLTADNIKGISKEILGLYKNNSRAIMNKAILNCMDKSIFDIDYAVMAKLIAEMSMLIAILFSELGEELGAYFIHATVKRFEECFETESHWTVRSKKLNNAVVTILNLFTTGLFDSEVIYDIFEKFCERFEHEKSVEIIDMALKATGFLLRKEDAGKMRDLIQKIQSLAGQLDQAGLSGARAKFILDSLTAIKNNNVAKLKMNDPVVLQDLIESTLKGVIKKSRVQCIPGSYKQVIQSAHWYSWTKEIVKLKPINDKSEEPEESTAKLFDDANIDYELRDKICKKLRINTPLRKDLFTAIFQCNDFLDAACKLISVGKKQFAEVMNIVIHVALNEKTYNEFYFHLIQHITTCDRKYKLALDFALRDKINQLEALTPKNRSNLSKLISNLLMKNVMAITVLKVVEFSDMNETYVEFIRKILEPIFSSPDDDTIQNVLGKIPKKDSFTSAIKLFITCFMSADSKKRYNSVRQLKMKNL